MLLDPDDTLDLLVVSIDGDTKKTLKEKINTTLLSNAVLSPKQKTVTEYGEKGDVILIETGGWEIVVRVGSVTCRDVAEHSSIKTTLGEETVRVG